MHTITRWGQLIVAGVVGVLIGIAVVVEWASPAPTAANTARSIPASAARGSDWPAPNAADRALLLAKQSAEAESYPVRIADVNGLRTVVEQSPDQAINQEAGPVELHEALRLKQQVETEAYPSRILLPDLSQSEAGAASIPTMHDLLLARQRVEAEYFPGH